MTIVLPFHSGDRKSAETWLRWVLELGGCRTHSLILMPARGLPDIDSMRELASKSFDNVSVLPDAEGIVGHPEGPNSMMRQAIWHCQIKEIGPWTFMEPDCIPLEPGWLDQWEREYRAFGKPFMGELRPANGTVIDYLTGNMVLPLNALSMAPMLARRGLSRDGVELAFDIVAASQTLPQAHLTKLLQQVPKNEDGSSHSFPSQASLALLRPGAILFHPCKDGSLMERLRERASRPNGAAASAPVQAGDKGVGIVPPSLKPPRPLDDPEIALLREQNRLLMERLGMLEKKLPVVQPKKRRTAAEQAKIDARMAKVRAGRKVAKT